jgi:hypothetical protein
MSYVDLKHALADLTIEAIRDPAEAAEWIPTLVAAAQSDVTEHRIYFERQTRRLRSFLTKYTALRPSGAEPDPLWIGVLLFNEGLYFECHEWLEAAWKRTAGPEKNFLHGIVQAAAAFYHYEKGNMHGARTLLGKALRRLEAYPPVYLQIEIDEFRNALIRSQARFTSGSDSREDPPVPAIKFTTSKTRELRGG